MKKHSFFTVIVLILILPFLFISCSKDEGSNEMEVFADAFTVKKVVDGEVRSAAAYYVYGNRTIAAARVIPPGTPAGTIELTAIDTRKLDFFHEPDSGEFHLIPPPAGSYLFEIESSEGETIQETDLLSHIPLNIPVINSSSFSGSSPALNTKWETVTGSDGIVVKLIDEQGDVIFASFALSPSVTEYTISAGGGNWVSSPTPGEDLILQVQSIVIEEESADGYGLYNIEGIAIAEKQIVWGN